MQIDVCERESDAIEAAAEAIADDIVEAGEGAVVALPGGRLGRALLTTLAAFGRIPWASVRWVATDECCGPEKVPDSTREVIMGAALAPNRIPARELSVPDPTLGPERALAAWEERLRALLEARGRLDLVVLVAGAGGGVAGFEPGVTASGLAMANRAGVVSLGPDALERAARVVVVATGASIEEAVTSALTAPVDVVARPLQRVLPDAGRVSWWVDRAAVGKLLADAKIVEA